MSMGTIPERIRPGTPEWTLFAAEHTQRYAFAASHVGDRDVLDAACGVGYGSAMLVRAGARHVTGLDIDAETIAYASKHFSSANNQFKRGDAQDMPFPAKSFDVVVSFETIEHVPQPKVFLREVHRVLRPGGLCIVSSPNATSGAHDHSHQNPYHLSEMDLETFKGLFEEYFLTDGVYHQSQTESGLRHSEMTRALETLRRPLSFSLFLRMENLLRKIMRRNPWALPPYQPMLERFIPEDFVIEPLDGHTRDPHVFLLVGKPR